MSTMSHWGLRARMYAMAAALTVGLAGLAGFARWKLTHVAPLAAFTEATRVP